jgi:hypothetical protein
MAHFAEINHENQVLRVVVVGNADCVNEHGQESEEVGVAFCKSLFGEDTNWKQTSYNGSFRKNYAGIGYFYDSMRDAFILPKPFESWKLNEVTCRWEPPVPMPEQDPEKLIPYVWSEERQEWIDPNLPLQPQTP